MKQRFSASLAAIAILLFATLAPITSNNAYADSTLNVTTRDDAGNTITGYWIEVRQSGSVVRTGFSPAAFTLPAGSYEVGVGDYGSHFFKQWSDGTTARYHPLTVGSTGTVSLTAIYSTSQSSTTPPPSEPTPTPSGSGITVSSQYVGGSSLVGMYVALQQNGATIATGFTPKTFTVTSGQQYTVIPSDYTNAYFNKWSDGTTVREKVVTATSTGISLTTLYTASPQPATSSPSFSVSASPTSLNILAGSSGSSTITATSTGGFNSAISLSISPSIAGVTATFSPTSVTPPSGGSATSTLTIATTSSAAPGTYTLTITGTSGSIKQTTTVTLTISSSSSSPPPSGNNLSIATKDDKGNSLTGYWIEVKQGGSVVKTGFSPASFNLAAGSYVVSVSDYGGYYFKQWSDGTTSREHPVTIGTSGTVSLTALYSTSQSTTTTPPPPTPETGGAPNTVTVKSSDLAGNPITGMYVNVRLNGVIVKDGFTPVTFNLDAGKQYVVVMYWCCDYEFRHFTDGTLTRYHEVTPSSSTGITLEARYELVPASQAAKLNVIAVDQNGKVIGGTTGSAEDGTLSAKPGMWMWLTPPGSSTPYSGAYTGSSSTPFKIFNAKTYTVSMSSFGEHVFDYWQDNRSTNPVRSFAMNGDSLNNVAVYKTVATASSTSSGSDLPFPWYDVDN